MMDLRAETGTAPAMICRKPERFVGKEQRPKVESESVNPKEYFMKKSGTVLLVSFAVLGLALWNMIPTSRSAADDDKGEALKKRVQQVADALKDKKDADPLAKPIANQEDLEDVMRLMVTRVKEAKAKPFGVGEEGAIDPDGIEAKLLNMSKQPMKAAKLKKEAAALEEMGYRVAAIARVAKYKPGAKVNTEKDKKDWQGWSDDMEKAALEFSDAANKQDAQALKKATNSLNSSCTNCHGKFRPDDN
jgi:cytochrome c556